GKVRISNLRLTPRPEPRYGRPPKLASSDAKASAIQYRGFAGQGPTRTHLNLLFFWGRAKGLVRAASHLNKTDFGPLPIGQAARGISFPGTPVMLWEMTGLGQLGDRPLLASPFIALSSLPSLPFSLFKFQLISAGLAPHVWARSAYTTYLYLYIHMRVCCDHPWPLRCIDDPERQIFYLPHALWKRVTLEPDRAAPSTGLSSTPTRLEHQLATSPHSHQQHREAVDRRYLDQPTMAAASVLAPNAHYPPQPYPSNYSHPPSSGPSVANMISSEPRRPSPDNESSTRQSLPSISEVISGARPGQYPPPAHPLQPGSSLPSPFAPSARQYPEADKHSSQPLHSVAFPPRQESHNAYSDSPRPPFSTGRPGLPPVSDRRPTPPTKHEGHPLPHHLAEPPKPSDHRSLNGVYSQPPPPPTSVPYQPAQLPPGQQPLPPYQVSPRGHAASHLPGQYDSRPAPTHAEEAEYAARARYDNGTSRSFESWSYQEALSRIGTCSRTIFNFAEAYGRIAQEQHGSQPIPERLPTEREVSDMLSNVEYLKRSLEQCREVIVASLQSERAREGAKPPKGPYEEDQDVPMYGDSIKPPYGMTEVKKRRGRAAPPGRCHSCNRIDTPEWRRGPDGARTLCNACGLHYAKLERKRQLEARSLRPKPEERS
ncbi:hypothetical protein N5P37_001368, partial [Trichoderma harzianum]